MVLLTLCPHNNRELNKFDHLLSTEVSRGSEWGCSAMLTYSCRGTGKTCQMPRGEHKWHLQHTKTEGKFQEKAADGDISWKEYPLYLTNRWGPARGGPVSLVWILKSFMLVFKLLILSLDVIVRILLGMMSLLWISFYVLSLLFGPYRFSEFTLAGPHIFHLAMA